MKSEQALGIAISEQGLHAVVLAASPAAPVVKASVALPLQAGDGLPAALARLGARLPVRQQDSLVLGLPLTRILARPLSLPFHDQRRQELAFLPALEEQLLVSVDELAGAFSPLPAQAGQQEGVRLLAWAAPKDLVRELLPPENAPEALDPDIICPSLQALAAQVQDDGAFLLVHGDEAEAAAALVAGSTAGGALLACRSLPLPLENEARGDALISGIRRSLAFFRRDNPKLPRPEWLALSGPLAAQSELAERLSGALQLEARRWRPGKQNGALAPEFDAALALARAGLNPEPTLLGNFRRGGLARKKRLFALEKLRLIASLAALFCLLSSFFLALQNHRYKARSARLKAEMTQTYKAAFPEVATVREPYLEMQAALKKSGLTASGRAQRPGALALVAEISRRLPPELELRVGRLSLDADVLTVHGETRAFHEVERARRLLAGSPLFTDVRIMSSAAGPDDGDKPVRFELRLSVQAPENGGEK